MIQAIKLNKIYKQGNTEFHVLKDVNLRVEKSEFVAIAGPSGAGKSTLLHLLGGLDAPTSGSVTFSGFDLYEVIDLYEISPDQRAKIRNKEIGFVFQFYHLMPEFNALENVMMPALIAGKASGARSRAMELLAAVGLSDRPTHKPNELSGGEQQRVAIARALINSPKVLLCDEPTGNLDSKTGADVVDVLLKLNRENSVTCIMVTHEEALAARAGRVVRMKDGFISEA